VIFLDTSAIYALADFSDPNHRDAVTVFDRAQRGAENFLLHNYILVEASTLLQRRLGLESALSFLQESERFHVHWVREQEHRQAEELLRQRGRRGLSLVDCVSFIVMRKEGVTQAVVFDADFEREGFQLFR